MTFKQFHAFVAMVLVLPMTVYAAKDYMHDPGPSAEKSRAAWAEATKGENLALGKKLTFSQTPDYRLTVDENDVYDLTDGTLSDRSDDRIWFNRDAVGWTRGTLGVNVLVDLGSVQPVGHVAARFLGGGEQSSLLYPSRIEVVGSNDGRTFFPLASLQSVNVGEKELAEENPDQYFNLPETGTAATSTFVLNVQREARYIGLHIVGRSDYVFTDQIAVIKAEDSAVRGLAGLEPTPFVIRGVSLRPRKSELVITTNLLTPNYFVVTDTRPTSSRDEPVQFFADLPAGVTVMTEHGEAEGRRVEAGGNGNRWVFDDLYNAATGKARSIYFALEEGATLSAGATATFSCDAPESEANAVIVPVRTIEIPEAGDTSGMDISLAWMGEGAARGFPNYFEAFQHMGFNMAGSFPRYYTTPERKEKLVAFVGETREHGMRVLYNESAFHVMRNHHEDEAELYNQINGEKGEYLCPTYTGQYYQEEIERIGRYAALIRPDEIFYDIEMWYYPAIEGRKCDRCQEAFEASDAADWDEYMIDQGTRMMRDLREATAGTGPDGGDPISGLYNVHAARPVYQFAYGFDAIYPEFVQLAQPSLYVRGNAQAVHDTIRTNYERIGSRNIVPWLSAGTYGEFDPMRVEQMILESFLNGARGITYYDFDDFDPMDFYYHARALKLLVPYKDMLSRGEAIAIEVSRDGLTCSAFGTDREALLLVGNYTRTPDNQTDLTLPGRSIQAVHDVKADRELDPSALDALEVDPGGQRLLHVTFAR